MKTKSYTEVRHTFAGPDPGRPKPGEMLVFRNEQGVVQFLCPCGRGNSCPTHVVPPEEKLNGPKGEWKNRYWGYDEKTITLHPSIRWTSGCKAHFFIKGGKVSFCADSGR